MICIFLGAPGSGKGTQAKRVCARLGIAYIGTGEILRDNIARGTELGKKVSAILDKGHLVDDETMIALIESEIKDRDSFVMDGFPRTVPQSEALDGLFNKYGKKADAVLFLDVNAEEVIKRALGRYVCPKCGRDYNVYLDDLKDKICPECGVALSRRSDDTEETIRERIAEYNRKTAPVKDYYAQKNVLKIINGSGSVDGIFDRILEALNNKN